MYISAVLPELSGDARLDLGRLRAYLIKLSDELEGTLAERERAVPAAVSAKLNASSANVEKLKEAVIRSASYIKSAEERLSATLKNDYVAKSEIGTYTEEAIADYTVNGKGLSQYFKLTESLDESVRSLCGYVKTGVLDDGEIGLEIGDHSGHSPFTVRLVNNRLSFFASGAEVAYISDSTLYITKAQISGALILGDYHVDLTNGVAFIWCGGETEAILNGDGDSGASDNSEASESSENAGNSANAENNDSAEEES